MIPDLTAAMGAPRVAGIEFPFGRALGQPHDIETQRAVLRAALEALEDTEKPGSVLHLPFEWGEPADQVHWHPAEPSPILKLFSQSPGLLGKLIEGRLPPAASRRDP